MSTFVTCSSLKCCVPDDFSYAISQGRTYSNVAASFTYPCPIGFTCALGAYPVTIIVKGGTIVWQPPPLNPNGPTTLSFPGCSSSIIENVPAGTTQDQYDAIVADILRQATEQQAGCEERVYRGGTASRPVFLNVEQRASCDEGKALQNISAVLPGFLSIDGSDLVLASGRFSSLKSQADANQQGKFFVDFFLAQALAEGTMTCEFPTLVAWWKADSFTLPDNSDVFANGDPAQIWLDQTVNGWNWDSSGAPAKFRTNQFNGLPAIVFAGTLQDGQFKVNCSDPGSILDLGTGDLSIIFVGTILGTGTLLENDCALPAVPHLAFVGSTILRFIDDSQPFPYPQAVDATYTNLAVLSMVTVTRIGGALAFYQNKVKLPDNGASTGRFSIRIMGTDAFDFGSSLPAKVGELQIYTGGFVQAQIDTIYDTYYKPKWGLP